MRINRQKTSSTWGGHKPLLPYIGRSLSVVGKALLPRAGIVHSAQSAERKNHKRGLRSSPPPKSLTSLNALSQEVEHPPTLPLLAIAVVAIAVAVAIAAAPAIFIITATTTVSVAVVAVVVFAGCGRCLPLSPPPPL